VARSFPPRKTIQFAFSFVPHDFFDGLAVFVDPRLVLLVSDVDLPLRKGSFNFTSGLVPDNVFY